MVNVNEIYEDLGSFGDQLGNLSPTFGTIARSISPETAASTDVSKFHTGGNYNLYQHVIDELAELGNTLASLNPRDVMIWG